MPSKTSKISMTTSSSIPAVARVCSYGGGLDSWAMLLDAEKRGELPDVAVFIDVGDGAIDRDGQDPGEWPSTYRHVREIVMPWCAKRGIEFVWLDSESYPVRDARSLFAWFAARKQIPVSGPSRICTTIAKVERFESWLADRFGTQPVEVWIGFEKGEEKRADKDPNVGESNQRRNRFPLMEHGLCRCRCLELARASGYPVPRKSACTFCLTSDTEVVTRDGIRTIGSLANDSYFGKRAKLLIPQVGKLDGLAHRGTFKEVKINDYGIARIWKVRLHRGRSAKVVRTTGEHRWFLVAGPQWSSMHEYERRTSDLAPGDRLRPLRAAPVTKERPMPVATAQGFVYGDGSHGLGERDERPASIRFHGRKREMIPFFVGHKAKKSIVYGLPRFWKKLPPLTESRSFLLSWLAGYLAADGTVSKTGQVTFESPSYETIQFVRSLLAVCGIGYSPIRSRLRKGFLKKPGRTYRLGIRIVDVPSWFFVRKHHRRNAASMKRADAEPFWTVDSVVETKTKERVFCATVPRAGAFALADDLMTGNCPYGSRTDWKTFARELPEIFAQVVELEESKPPTKKNNVKLSIMGFSTRKKKDGTRVRKATPLPMYVAASGKPTKAKPCAVCGAAERATKATGCDYLEEASS